MNLRQRIFATVGAGVTLCCIANIFALRKTARAEDHANLSAKDTSRIISRSSDEFLPDSLRAQYGQNSIEMGSKKIVVNVGMPRTGTNTWIEMMKGLYPGGGEFHHIYERYAPEDLSELLLRGNQSSVANPLYRLLTRPPKGDVRAMVDHPFFLLAPIARDFPEVHFIQMTRELEPHVNSTLYMLQRWCQDRCTCDKAPKCTSAGNMALVDRLYFDRFHALRFMCDNNGDASKIPRDLVRTWLATHEAETGRDLRGHPRALRLRLEDGARANAGRMARFLGLGESALGSLDFDALHANKGSAEPWGK
ncbi:hypothetical protein ACHAXT_010961 [Thalassiosira profunda]